MLKIGTPSQHLISPLWHFIKNEKKIGADLATIITLHHFQPLMSGNHKGLHFWNKNNIIVTSIMLLVYCYF